MLVKSGVIPELRCGNIYDALALCLMYPEWAAHAYQGISGSRYLEYYLGLNPPSNQGLNLFSQNGKVRLLYPDLYDFNIDPESCSVIATRFINTTPKLKIS